MLKSFLVVAALVLIGSLGSASAQSVSLQVNGTQHGVAVTYTQSTPGANPLAGYNVYRCPGTCLATDPNWVLETATPNSGLIYVDPSTNGFTNGSTYSYVVQPIDTKGNVAPVSNVATVAVPSTGFPSNPSAVTATAKVQ